ncbi:MAG: TetR/AcrR family transcriptional regulator [Celeribacter sp.]|jgi:AcrR family transcriptional regulator
MTRKRKGPGRPEGPSTLPDEILDVSETMFADLGFAGTSLRQVAESVQANPALINYYYSNKGNLFRAVFLRRGLKIAEERMRRLDLLKESGNPTVEDLVRAFLEPSERLRDTKQGRAFLRLHARLHMEPEEISYELRREVYQESTLAYARAFELALPNVPPAAIYHKISLMVGSYLYAFSDTNRLQQLADPTIDSSARAALLKDTIDFVTAGMLAGQG